MRKFLSTTAGATFNECNPNFTICVRKDCVELIVKLNKGVYAIVNMRYADKEHIMLSASWGRFFKRFAIPTVLLPRIKATCPKLYQLLTHGLDNFMMVHDAEIKKMCIGSILSRTSSSSLICQIDDELVEAVFDMVNTIVSVYREIKDNPPFPAWKDRLDEVWQ